MSLSSSTPLIRADYPALEHIAQQFDVEQTRTARMVETVQTHLSRLRRGGWEGNAADAFFLSIDDDVLPALTRLTNALEAGSDTTREIIRVLKAAEEEAASALKGATDGYAGQDSATAHADAAEPAPIRTKDSGKPDDVLRVRYSPFFQEATPEPPVPMTDEQRAALVELGITVPEDTALTEAEAQAILDFYAAHPGLLAEGMTAAEAQEAITIVDRMQDVGFDLGLSPYNPKPWSLSDLEHLNTATEAASQTMYDQFFAQFEDPASAETALALIAERMGTAPDDAALRLFFSPQGIAFSFLRDAGVNIYDNAQGDSSADTVGYTGNNTEVYRAYDGEYTNDQQQTVNYTIVYNPTPEADGRYEVYAVYRGQPPAEYVEDGTLAPNNPALRETIIATTERNARFYGWYSGNDVILADSVLMMRPRTEASGPVTGVFTPDALILHEEGHSVDNANPDLSTSLEANTGGLTYNARTSTAANEIRADIIMNGLLDRITTNEQQANYDAYVARVLEENFEGVTGTSISAFEAEFAEAEVTPEATETPSDSKATPDPPNI